METHACLELALEGERLCKSGDFHGGVAFFEAAIRFGTDDMRTLSAVYSQLGNAYFYLGDYNKALEYHKNDLTIARAIGDEPGEGKASGNLGNTLKVMGKYDEAVTCCERHLTISRKLHDKVGEGRALYNLGNVYHAKGKRFACLGLQDPGEFPEEVKSCLQQAVEYYEKSLEIMVELGDRSAQGRACGNLGNTHYLLGNFRDAIIYHEERLKIAKEYRDLAAERRAHNNLGNAHIFLSQFQTAASHYRKTLALAIELHDKAVEAQACYSLGNTYTLLHEYPTAIEFHLRHLKIAQELKDRIGEGRAYWSLGNAHSAIGNHTQALHYANKHLEVSKEIGDYSGEVSAQHSICDLQRIIDSQDSMAGDLSANSSGGSGRMRRVSMEQMNLLKLTPESKAAKTSTENRERYILKPMVETTPSQNVNSGKESQSGPNSCSNEAVEAKIAKPTFKEQQKERGNSVDEESFFDLLSRFQSKRMDDQRCSLALLENKENNQLFGNSQNFNHPASSSPNGNSTSSGSEASHKVHDDLFDLIAGMQSRRLDEQRASLPGLNLSSVPLQRNSNNNSQLMMLQRSSVDAVSLPDDDFFDMLMRCQASRIEDQRSSMPDVQQTNQGNSYSPEAASNKSLKQSAPTVPDEDFFSLIMRFQAGRLEDQRSALPGASSSSSNGSVSSGNGVRSRKNSSTIPKPNVQRHKLKTETNP